MEGEDSLLKRSHILRVGPFAPNVTTKDLQGHFAQFGVKFRIKWSAICSLV